MDLSLMSANVQVNMIAVFAFKYSFLQSICVVLIYLLAWQEYIQMRSSHSLQRLTLNSYIVEFLPKIPWSLNNNKHSNETHKCYKILFQAHDKDEKLH